MQGRSLVPLLRGESPQDWRESFYYHYYEGPAGEHHVYPHEGVTTGQAKLIHYYARGEWELFDHAADSQERNNLWNNLDHAALQARLQSELARQRNELEVPPLEGAPDLQRESSSK